MQKRLFERKKEETKKEGGVKTLTVKKSRCPQNHPCPSIRVCPVGALQQKGFLAPEVDMDACIRCGKCMYSCLMGALVLE